MALDRTVIEHGSYLQQQQAAGEVVAFFDLDRTLILGYSIVGLALQWLREGNPGGRRIAVEILSSIDRRLSGGNYTRIYRSLVRGLAGMEEGKLLRMGESAFEHNLEASLFREARQIIRQHQQLGHKVVIISAATDYQVAPVARALQVDAWFGTRLKVVRGKFTGEIQGTLCHGEGKVIAARRYLRQQQARVADAWFYSDSSDDLPLLKKVGYPVATNPAPALAEYAARQDWSVLRFSSRGTANLESILRTALTANAVATTAVAGAASWLMSRSPSKAANRMTTWLGDIGVAVAGLEFEIAGIEHLESVRPAIFTFNHQSYLDSVVMAHLVRHDFVAFCKQEVANNRLLGPLLRAHGTIFVDRGQTDQSLCLQQAGEALRNGKSLVIAPEGTRSATGVLLDFKQGAFYMARKMRVPIVPVVLHNVSDALPKGSMLVRPAKIQVSVLPPLWPEDIRSIRSAGEDLRGRYRRIMRAPFVADTSAALPSVGAAGSS